MPHVPRPRFKSLFCLLLCLYCLTCPPLAKAAEPNEKPSTATRVDVAHGNITERLNRASQWFDNFFNDPRIDEEPAGTLLRLRGSSTISESEGLSFNGKIKVNVALPNLKNRFHLILSNEDDDIKNAGGPDTQASERLRPDEKSTSLGLQYTKRTKKNLIYSNRVTIDYDDGLKPRLRTRVRYKLPVTEKSLLNLTQAFSWEDEDGFGQENRIDYDYILSDNTLLRSTGSGLFSEASDGYEWLAMQQLLTSFSHKKALTLGAYTLGETRPQNHVTEYVLFTEYRQSFIKKWLFFEIRPEISWQREKEFKAITALTLTLEVRFGDRN